MQTTGASAARVQLELIGSRVDVVVLGSGAPALEKAIHAAWDRCLAEVPSVPPQAVVDVVLDDDPAVASAARARGALAGGDMLQIMSSLSSTLTLKAIELQHGRLLMLHACALAHPDTGDTVVLVAPSGTGKTTAAMTLGRELGYLTDETAAIGFDDQLIPYPKPLSVLVDGTPPKHQVSPTELGLRPAPQPRRVTAIALLDRVDHAVTPSIEVVPVLEALPAIAEQSSALQLLPRPLHLVAELLERTGGLRRITYREVSDAATLIRSLTQGGRP